MKSSDNFFLKNTSTSFYNHISHFLVSLLSILILQSLSLICRAQYYDVGQDPGKTKWKQINTEHFIIIFPENFTSEALKLAKILDYSYLHVSKSLDHKPHKIPVIIHNQTTISNAYALWAPRRMEYYTCTPQSAYGQAWLEQLGLHEYRHIVQMDMINQGGSRICYYLFGEQSIALLFGLYIPSWLMEGDAVVTETALSMSGRGRIPEFEMYVRANLFKYGLFNYDKAVMGSYKNFIPSDYYFGYHMVTTARNEYGSSLWAHAQKQVAKNPFSITGIKKPLKKETGLTTDQLYYHGFLKLDSLWRKQEHSLKYNDFRVLSPKFKLYTNYTSPYYINDTTYLALKSGLDFEKQFVVIGPHKEKRIFTPGFFNPVKLTANREGIIFSFGENKRYEELVYNFNGRFITWSEVQYDKRWTMRTWHVIKVYDLENKKIRTLTRKTRLFAPAMSPDNKTIAAVEVTSDNKFSLVLIDASNGKTVNWFNTEKNDFFITPSWSEDGKYIYTVFMNQDGMKGILEINVASQETRKIMAECREELYRPVKKGNYIFFNSGYSGIDNIYALNLNTSKISRVTSARFGAFNANISPGNDKIIYSNYTAGGYELAEIELDTTKWIPREQVINSSIRLYETYVKQENNVLVFDSLPDKNYEVKKYGKFVHLFNFHSWLPASVDINTYRVSPGLMLLSQNRLSTAFTILNYGYDLKEKTSSISAEFTYKGWYPEISISYRYGDRRSYFREYVKNKDLDYSWNEGILSLNLSVPLNLTRGRYFRYVRFKTGWDQVYVIRSSQTPDSVFTGDISALSAGFEAYNLLKTCERDISSRWGQMLSMNWKKSVLKDNAGSLFSLQAYLLFPGPFRHHVIKLSYGYQQATENKYRFNSVTEYPRGIKNYYDKNMRRYSIDYKFPFWYPDFRIGPVLYFKRFKSCFFFDYAEATNHSGKQVYYKTTGIELTTDVHILRSIIPFNVGVRYINNLGNHYKTSFDFLFSFNFDSF